MLLNGNYPMIYQYDVFLSEIITFAGFKKRILKYEN